MSNKSALIGYSGFVGSNLKEQINFDDFYNSKNIHTIENRSYDLVVCSGISSEMWIANSNPSEDLRKIIELIEILKTVQIKKLVLISTVAVYSEPISNVSELNENYETQAGYGRNRLHAENELRKIFKNILIIRLPALFGRYLKKNFIYDLQNLEPSYLKIDKYDEITQDLKSNEKYLLNTYYKFNTDKNMYSFQKDEAIKKGVRTNLLEIFTKANFTALNFTNPESRFQFYFLDNLSNDINICIENKLSLVNICSEPIYAKQIAKDFFDILMENNSSKKYEYNVQSYYSNIWGGNRYYQYSKVEIYRQLKEYFRRCYS